MKEQFGNTISLEDCRRVNMHRHTFSVCPVQHAHPAQKEAVLGTAGEGRSIAYGKTKGKIKAIVSETVVQRVRECPIKRTESKANVPPQEPCVESLRYRCQTGESIPLFYCYLLFSTLFPLPAPASPLTFYFGVESGSQGKEKECSIAVNC